MTSALGSLLPTGDKGFLLDSQNKQEIQKPLYFCACDLQLSDPRHQALVCVRGKKTPPTPPIKLKS